MSTRQIRLVVNPSSGKGRALELLPHVAGILRDTGDELEILLSRTFDEARAMTETAVTDGIDVLAVMGGDGMMHLGVNTCARAHLETGSRTTLGLIPAGTGLAYHTARRRNASGLTESEMEALTGSASNESGSAEVAVEVETGDGETLG